MSDTGRKPVSTVTARRPSPVHRSAPVASATGERTAATVIVGGGIAGLACARRLHDARQPFRVITEDLGGRIRRSRDGAVNLGAYFVRADYHHVNRFVRLERRIDTLQTVRHGPDGDYSLWDSRLFLHLPQAARFLTQLLGFRRHYEAFKRNCVTMSQAEALRSDAFLWRLYHQPANEFVRDNRIGAITRDYLAPGSGARCSCRSTG